MLTKVNTSSNKGLREDGYKKTRSSGAHDLWVLDAQSCRARNLKDTKDHPKGVWTLPPNLRLGDENKAKYLSIGESDRMTLLFKKI